MPPLRRPEDTLIDPGVAQKRVLRHATVLGTETVTIDESLGRVLAADVRTRIAMPAFDNSAMDGYAVRSRDTRRASPARPVELEIKPTVFAGDGRPRRIAAGQACGIMTGAKLPGGADSVVPVEIARVDRGTLRVDAPVEKLRHVRRKGEEARKNHRVAARGMFVHPGVVAAVASAGVARLKVFRKPRVSVITTGDETVAPGTRIAAGQIYDSNSFAVAAMLRRMGIEPVRVSRVKDSPGILSRTAHAALRTSDVVILLGGVSVGDRDFVRPVLDKLGVEKIFWRVRQKPGKPIYFGKMNRKLVFGLPGNPASGFVCFYLYVYPAIRKLAGFRQPSLVTQECAVGGPVTPDARRWTFLKASLRGDEVVPLKRQGSHMVTSLSETNGLIVVPPGETRLRAGVSLSVVRLPDAEDVSS